MCLPLCVWCVRTSDLSCLLAADLSDARFGPLGWCQEAKFAEKPSARRRASVWGSSLGGPVVVPEY